jgi:alpha-tubulin suppressor-like RCC1 family protein
MLGFVGALAACGSGTQPSDGLTGPKFQLNIAPLKLDGVGEAIYALTVLNGNGETVWTNSDVRSTRYGNGSGSITFVGACDASSNPNTVRIDSLQLFDDNGAIPSWTWQNPIPVEQQVVCEENADVLVEFNLTILRDANQGFFDIGVNFEDIFCSAKFDCTSELLHNEEGQRDRTAVMGFACTSGAGENTVLHMNDILVQCDGGSYWFDPSQEKGNAGPLGPIFYQTAIYRGSEQFQNQNIDKCYWNNAFGINAGPDAINCHIYASATASSSVWDGGTSPENAVYPYVVWDVQLTDAAGQIVCESHPLNGEPLGVGTDYTRFTGARFEHQVACNGGALETSEIVSADRILCQGSVNDGGPLPVTFFSTPTGVSVGVDAERTTNYTLPAGYSIVENACCTNRCCDANEQSWVSVASNDSMVATVKADGSLWRWGSNNASYPGGTSNSEDPAQSGCDYDWAKVFSGVNSVQYGIKKDGSLYGWGLRRYLFGPEDPQAWDYAGVPVQMGSASDWKAVASGGYLNLGLKNDGSIVAWGDAVPTGIDPETGALQNETNWTPTQVGTDTDWATISVSEKAWFQVAVKTNGTLWVWGDFGKGLDDPLLNAATPTQLFPNETNWKMAVAGRHDHVIIAIKNDGTLWAVGRNNQGALGIGEEDQGYLLTAMTQIGTDTDWQSVAASSGRFIAIKMNGSAWAWGLNEVGSLGFSTDIAVLYAPTRIGTGLGWRTAALTGGAVSYLIDANGQIFGAGRNDYDILNLNDFQWQDVTQFRPMIVPTEPGEWCSQGFYKDWVNNWAKEAQY